MEDTSLFAFIGFIIYDLYNMLSYHCQQEAEFIYCQSALKQLLQTKQKIRI